MGAVVIALLVAACGSTSTESLTGPARAKCGLTLSTSEAPVDASGGTRTVTVTTTPECAWTAAADVSWISEVAPATGQGTGGVQFRADANPNATAREGGITVNDQRAIVRQAAAECHVQPAISNGQFTAAGGPATVTVTAPSGCAWTASASAAWINLTPPVSGSGAGTVSVSVSLNTGFARSGTITVGGVDLPISQVAASTGPPPPPPPPSCSVSLQPTSVSMPAGGGGSSVAVTTTAGCAWTAASQAPWITITPPASGNGSGSKAFTVTANTSTATRSGTITIGGSTLTVNQAACTFEIDRTSQTIGADGSVGAPVTVTTQPGCPWTSTANVNWLHITSGASGTGTDNVTFTVDSSGGSSRTGTLTIAGRIFTVNQERCTATLTPENQSVSSLGGPFSVSLATQTGCTWTATSGAVWLTITNGASGTGEKTVNYLVLPNPGGDRTGTLTFVVSGDEERLTVTQDKN